MQMLLALPLLHALLLLNHPALNSYPLAPLTNGSVSVLAEVILVALHLPVQATALAAQPVKAGGLATRTGCPKGINGE